MENQTYVSEFLLLEFSNTWELQILHFLLFFLLYLATVTGNLLIISAVAFDHHLHTPMYFFLSLAIQDLGSVSAIMPKSMVNSLLNTRHISYFGCVAELFLFLFFAGSDFFLLTVMAYDRYIAICYPLQYEMIMNQRACAQMLATVWISSALNAGLHTGGIFSIPFCSNVVNQFFCEISKVFKVTCSPDLNRIELGYIVFIVIIAFGCFIFIIVTYVSIFTAVLRMPSVQGRQKAFTTCLPHITVTSIFLFTSCFATFMPPSKTTTNLDLAFTILYSIVPPMLNPVIYSMRNKNLKTALIKLLDLMLLKC